MKYLRQCGLGIAVFIISALWVSSSAFAAKRLALVVGNSVYPQWPLVNPVNDATAIAAKLKELDFDVTIKLELERDDIGLVTEEFLSKVSPSDIVVFFYAGHGVQVSGQNFLLATDARIRTQFDVHRNGIDFSRFLRRLDATRASVKLIFLDACRNNPFESRLRGGSSRGLASVGGAPFGTIISFATQPGGVAADGRGKHGLYTASLLKHIDVPGLPVEQMLKRVAASTHQASGGKQQPWVEGSLYGEFSFKEAPAERLAATLAVPKNESGATRTEDYSKLAWDFATESDDLYAYQAFVQEFPSSPYARLARVKIAVLNARSKRVASKQTSLAATAQEQRLDSEVLSNAASTPRLTSSNTVTDDLVSDEMLSLASASVDQLNGRTLGSLASVPFDVEVQVQDNELRVNKLIWSSPAFDAVGYSNESMRCGLFTNALSISTDGNVTGSCGAGDVTVDVSGTLHRLVFNVTYLAAGGRTSGGNSTVGLQLR